MNKHKHTRKQCQHYVRAVELKFLKDRHPLESVAQKIYEFRGCYTCPGDRPECHSIKDINLNTYLK